MSQADLQTLSSSWVEPVKIAFELDLGLEASVAGSFPTAPDSGLGHESCYYAEDGTSSTWCSQIVARPASKMHGMIPVVKLDWYKLIALLIFACCLHLYANGNASLCCFSCSGSIVTLSFCSLASAELSVTRDL